MKQLNLRMKNQKLSFLCLLIFICPQLSAQSYSWSKVIGGLDYDKSKTISVDKSQNLIVGGSFGHSVDFDPSSGGAHISALTSSPAGSASFIAKYDSSGNYIWASRIGGIEVSMLDTDNQNNIIAIGFFHSTQDFDPNDNIFYPLTAQGGGNTFILKLDSNGVFKWAKNLGGTSQVAPNSIKIDHNNNLYLSGIFYQTGDFDPDSGSVNVTSNGGSDVYLLKLDSNGTYLWSHQFGSKQHDFSSDLSIDKYGNSYVSGFFSDTINFDTTSNNHILTSSIVLNSYIAKYDTYGNFQWVKQLGDSPGWSQVLMTSSFIDSYGNILTTGGFSGTPDFDPGINSNTLTATSSNNSFISKLDSNGNFVWVKGIFGTFNRDNERVCTDELGNILITGSFRGTVDLDPGSNVQSTTSRGGLDAFIVSLNKHGDYRWGGSIGGSEDILINGIDLDNSMNMYYTGSFKDQVDLHPFSGRTIRQSNNFIDFFISKIKLDFVTGLSSKQINQDVHLFPNPARNVVHINSSTTLPSTLSIYNINGSLVKIVRTNSSESISIDVSAFSPGRYIVKSEAGSSSQFTTNFIVYD